MIVFVRLLDKVFSFKLIILKIKSKENYHLVKTVDNKIEIFLCNI